MTKKYDYIVVGAGLYGAMFTWKKIREGKKVLVIDKRPYPGGNIYCENIHGINVHKYGAHIFHTSNKKVWELVNSFVEFNRYTNSPLAYYKGHLYNMPFNMNTFYAMWGVKTPQEAAGKLEEQRKEIAELLRSQGVSRPRNLEEQALLLVGRDIYETLIKGYTQKQWGRDPSLLPSFIIKRLPVRLTFDNNYFNDTFQGIPIGGYNKLIEGLLSGADLQCDTDFFHERGRWEETADKILFTGRIDEYYGYRLGKLEYRSLRFEHKVLDCPNYQGNAVINYTDTSVPYTRIIEHKHFEQSYAYLSNPANGSDKTVITWEYPLSREEEGEPYYPVNDEKNNRLYEKYRELAAKEKNVIFGGRLGEYKYYDMHQIVEKLL